MTTEKVKTKLNFYQNISNYYDEMNIRRQNGSFQFEEDHFSKNVESISKICHEVSLLEKLLQVKPQIKSMKIEYSDLYCTVIKNRVEKEIEYFTFNEFITPCHYNQVKKMKSQMYQFNNFIVYKQR